MELNPPSSKLFEKSEIEPSGMSFSQLTSGPTSSPRKLKPSACNPRVNDGSREVVLLKPIGSTVIFGVIVSGAAVQPLPEQTASGMRNVAVSPALKVSEGRTVSP